MDTLSNGMLIFLAAIKNAQDDMQDPLPGAISVIVQRKIRKI
jgi:hypothetical protein